MSNRVFISHSTKDKDFVDNLVEHLRDHYIETFYAPRNMPGGRWEENLITELNNCDCFLVVLSSNSLESDYVKFEINTFLDISPDKKVIPVLAEQCPWERLHERINEYQLFDFVQNPREANNRLLHEFGINPHIFPPVVVGDIKIPVFIFVGGDGHTKFHYRDIICEGPGILTDDSRVFTLEGDIQEFARSYIPKRQKECEEKSILFINNPQVRLNHVSWGASNENGGLDNQPLRLKLGWTSYYHTVVTNGMTHERLPDGSTIGQKYAADIDKIHDCRLSNPIAANMSIITKDNYIFFGIRSHKVQTLPGNYQPAVSGDGQPEDLDKNGVYDPFQTALREASEECFGLLVPPPSVDDVTFFGLGRWKKTRFPFLFGEIRVNATANEVMSYEPTQRWEGERFSIPFTVESVTDWCVDRYQDYYNGRTSAASSASIFSLLQSLRYAYPDKWPEVIRRCTIHHNSPS